MAACDYKSDWPWRPVTTKAIGHGGLWLQKRLAMAACDYKSGVHNHGPNTKFTVSHVQFSTLTTDDNNYAILNG